MLCERSQIQKAVILLILHSIKDKIIEIETEKVISGFQGLQVETRINYKGHKEIWRCWCYSVYLLQ